MAAGFGILFGQAVEQPDAPVSCDALKETKPMSAEIRRKFQRQWLSHQARNLLNFRTSSGYSDWSIGVSGLRKAVRDIKGRVRVPPTPLLDLILEQL